MRFLGTKAYVAVGLGAIVTTAVVFAMLIGLLPDRHGAQRDGRASLAESVAASASALLSAQEERRLQSVLHFIMSRNPEYCRSRCASETGASDLGRRAHRALGSDRGRLVLRHSARGADLGRAASLGAARDALQAADHAGIHRVAEWPGSRLLAFITAACLVAFYFYLGRVLRQLVRRARSPAGCARRWIR